MSRSVRIGAAAAAALVVLATPGLAAAFCGFYVGGAGANLYNNATQVVLMREGTRTVLSMQNNYQGPPKNFALVVPVPVVLQKENVKTLDPAVFAKVDRLAAPRLVEYWERDPCKPYYPPKLSWLGGIGGGGRPGGGGGFGVKIEAKFAVGEYQILILSAGDSTGLERWLRAKKYNIPQGAATYLRPYIQGGSKFFVAKVDVTKVKFVKGQAMLSPLRVHYDSKTFSLPIRLGLMNAKGKQDLIVHILAKGQRYEVANYKNVTIPTNIDVHNAVRKRFGEFYAALFDKTIEKNPGAVVTEYAWDSATCDPCPSPPLTPQDLTTLGADVLAGGEGKGGAANLIIEPNQVKGDFDPATARRYLRRHRSRMLFCYTSRGLLAKPELRGRVVLKLKVAPTGRVASANAPVDTLKHGPTVACLLGVARRMRFPKPDNGKPFTLTYPLRFRPTGGRRLSVTPGPRGRGMFGRRGFVLTRLHARYGKGSAKDDLTFRKAEPLLGGRELRYGQKLERGGRVGSFNNFQGRYIIRHRWTGPIKCQNPVRNRWGGPPPGKHRNVRAATNLAFAPRGKILLASVIGQPIPALELQPAAVAAGGGAAGGSMTATVQAPAMTTMASAGGNADPSISPMTPSTKDSREKKKGCGCTSGSGADPTAALVGILFAFVWIRRRACGA